MALEASNPYIGEYDAYAVTAKQSYQDALARIANQRGSYLAGYGLDASGRPVADNPYGAYQQMMGGLADSAEQVDAMERSRGFHGGLSKQAVQTADRLARQTTYDFGRRFEQGLSGFSDAEQQAGSGYNADLSNKMAEIVQKAIQDRAFNPADFSGLDNNPYGEPMAPNPASPGLPWTPPNGSGLPATGGPTLEQMLRRVRMRHPNWTAAQIRRRAKQNIGGK